jgi:hypothetical protein
MTKNIDWLPTRMPDQLVMFQNIAAKLENYQTVLPITTAQQDRIVLICNTFIGAYTYAAQAKSAVAAIRDWRDNVFYGSPAGTAAPVPPGVIAAVMPVGAFIGIFEEFRKLVDLIKSSPGYTRAIGEDLMIVAPAANGDNGSTNGLGDLTPELKVAAATGYKVNVAGSLKGMDAMRIEYRRSGGEWVTAAFFTKTPGEFTVTPQTPGQPETGHVRGIFIKKNEPVGVPSADYPVTVS